MSKVWKSQLASTMSEKEMSVSVSEAAYYREPTLSRLVEWQQATHEYCSVFSKHTTKNMLAQRRRKFEFGDKNGRLLAYLAQPEFVPLPSPPPANLLDWMACPQSGMEHLDI